MRIYHALRITIFPMIDLATGERRQIAPPPSPRSLRPQIGLAFFAFILIGANDGALGVLLPSIRGFYGVDKATIGLLFLAGTAGYLGAAFTSGLLVERL